MFSDPLMAALYGDRHTHPERLPATCERVTEVLKIAARKSSKDLASRCRRIAGGPRDYLTEAQAREITSLLRDRCSTNEIRVTIEMLMESEVSMKEAIDLHEQYKIPVSHLEKDIVPVRGEGAWITDILGDVYLDMDSNYSATNLGMNNPEIARGLFNQANQLISMKEDRVHVPRTRFLKSIHAMMPKGLDHFYWQNSGGEAVDKALKIAKAHTGHPGVIAFEGGFHGRTHGAVAVTYNEKYRRPFFLNNVDWVHFAPFNDHKAVEKLLADGKAKTVILELVQGEEAGNRPARKAFAKKLRQICDSYKAVMIVDEIQSGFGRTAKKEGQWFSCMTYDVVPDIITIGKSFGGGYPVTAVVTSKKISRSMKSGYDGSTFGGNPMAMVAAMIATRQMREKNITKNVILRSRQFSKGLQTLKRRYKGIGEVRITGLMLGFELPSAKKVSQFQTLMRKNGVKTSLATGSFVRYLPPLIVTEEDVQFLLDAMGRTFAKIL